MTKRQKPKKTMKEDEFIVKTSDETPGAKELETQTKINAATSADAARIATQKNPRAADSVVVQKASEVKPNVPGVVPTTETYTRPSMKKIVETVHYPYSVSLPRPFRTFLETSGIPYTERGNMLMFTHHNKSQLLDTLRLLKNSDEQKATVIMDGIGRSI